MCWRRRTPSRLPLTPRWGTSWRIAKLQGPKCPPPSPPAPPAPPSKDGARLDKLEADVSEMRRGIRAILDALRPLDSPPKKMPAKSSSLPLSPDRRRYYASLSLRRCPRAGLCSPSARGDELGDRIAALEVANAIRAKENRAMSATLSRIEADLAAVKAALASAAPPKSSPAAQAVKSVPCPAGCPCGCGLTGACACASPRAWTVSGPSATYSAPTWSAPIYAAAPTWSAPIYAAAPTWSAPTYFAGACSSGGCGGSMGYGLFLRRRLRRRSLSLTCAVADLSRPVLYSWRIQ